MSLRDPMPAAARNSQVPEKVAAVGRSSLLPTAAPYRASAARSASITASVAAWYPGPSR